jgi:hypothetical protein
MSPKLPWVIHCIQFEWGFALLDDLCGLHEVEILTNSMYKILDCKCLKPHRWTHLVFITDGCCCCLVCAIWGWFPAKHEHRGQSPPAPVKCPAGTCWRSTKHIILSPGSVYVCAGESGHPWARIIYQGFVTDVCSKTFGHRSLSSHYLMRIWFFHNVWSGPCCHMIFFFFARRIFLYTISPRCE